MNNAPLVRMARAPAPASSPGPLLPPAMPPDQPTRKPLRAGLFGVVDIGSTKVCCLIGRAEAEGVRVAGFGLFASKGVRGGGIIDLDEAERAVRKAVAQAEEKAQHRLREVVVNLSCGHPESRPVNLQWPIGGRPVTDADLRRVLQEVRVRAEVEGREPIHLLPLSFTVDETPGVKDPRNLHCETLTVRAHALDAGSTALRNLMTTVERCELNVAELVSAPVASGYATLVEDERQLGATVIDMGGGTTSLAVFNEGNVVHTAQFSIGGNQITNDLARLLSTPVAHAERLKTLYGNAEGSPDDEREMLPVPLVGEEDHHINRVPRSQVVAIIRPRLEETFEMVRERMERSGVLNEAGARVVLTGGASQLVGAREMAARILERQVRLGRPQGVRGLPELHDGPAFATAAGLLAWAAGAGGHLAHLDTGEDAPRGLVRRIVDWLRDRV